MSSVRQTVLPNGIHVVTDNMPGRHFAHIAVSVRVGGMHEPDAVSGISHLLEHVIFRGTPHASGAEIQTRFARIGAQLNAQVKEDETRFVVDLLASDTADALGWLCEMISAPALRAEDIDIERQIIEQENCRGCFTCTMREALYAEAFAGQSLRNPVIGYEDTLSSLTPEDLRAWHARHYTGANMAVVVAGDVDHDAIVAAAGRGFGQMPAGTPAALPSLSYTPGAAQLSTTCPQAALWTVVPLLGLSDEDYQALMLLRDVLAGGPHALLLRELREKRGLVYDIECLNVDLGRDSLLHLHLVGDAARLREIFEVTCGILRDVAAEVSAEDFAFAKALMNAGVLRMNDEPAGRAEWACRDLLETGTLHDFDTIFARYHALRPADISRLAARVLATEPSFAVQGPTRHVPREADLRAMWAGEAAPQRRRGLFSMAS